MTKQTLYIKSEEQVREDREIKRFVVMFLLIVGFIFGVWFGRWSAIKTAKVTCYDEYSYVIDFQGHEHLYLK